MIETPWQIQLLGAFSVQRPPLLINRFQTYKTGALLAFLAYHVSQPASREALIELLWPETSPSAGRNSLSVALSALRRRLEPPGTPVGAVLQANRTHVTLAVPAVQTDVAAFRAALQQAAAAPEEGQAVVYLGEAAALYQGNLLPDYYEDWVGAEREYLKDLYLDALRRLVRHHSRQQTHETAIEYAHRAIRADPLRESSHRMLMRLYAACGRPAASLDHFRSLEQLLKQALDATPGRATRDLMRQITDANGINDIPGNALSVLPLPATAPPEKPTLAPQIEDRLPLPLTRFFGRTEDAARIQELLSDPSVRLLTLTGLGGIGKTRLAVEAATGLRDVFPGGMLFVSLADITEPERILEAVLAAISQTPDPEVTAWEQAIQALSGPSRLLILDNFEHLVEQGAPIIHRLLMHVPALNCLVTSRECLNVSGEQVYPVPPLPPLQSLTSLDAIAAAPSVQLFVDRAQARRVDFQVTPGNARAIATLCSVLDGMPLALELAAAWARVLTPPQMLARLQHRFDMLQGRARDLPARHQSLRAVLDSSYAFLTPESQRLFTALSVFRGGWTLEAAARVCEDADEETILDHLRRLQEKSLITAVEVHGEIRSRMLETVREYAAGQLPPDLAAHLWPRHFSFFAALAAAARDHLSSADQAFWMNQIAADLDNIRAALSWGKTANPSEALGLAADLTRFWWVRGHTAEAQEFLETTLAVSAASLSRESRLRALGAMGDLAQRQGDFPRARAAFEDVLAACRAHSDLALEAQTLGSIGEILMNQGDYATARDFLERAHALHNDLGRDNLGHERGGTATLSALGYVAREMGDYVAARSFLEQAVSASEQQGDTLTAAADRGSLAHVRLAQGDIPGAERLFQRTLADYRVVGNRPGQAWTLASLAQVGMEQGAFAAAHTHLEKSLAINQEIGNRAGEAWNLDSLGVVLQRSGNLSGAREALDSALALSRAIGGRSLEAWTLCHLGDAERARGKVSAARKCYEASLRLMVSQEMRSAFGAPLVGLAEVCVVSGDIRQAAILLGAIKRLRQESGATLTPLTHAQYERLAEAIRTGLGKQDFAEALDRGREATLLEVVNFAVREDCAD